MERVVFASAADLGNQLALEIVRGLQEARSAGRPYLLGCPAGRSGKSTYSALARIVGQRQMLLSSLFIISMDAYVTRRSERFIHVPRDQHHSCERFIHDEIVGPLNEGTTVGGRISDEHVWMPDPNDPWDYERRIESMGGIDLFILASGSTDGHVGFNPPGATRDSKTRIVALAESTRKDNLKTYPDFASVDSVPEYGVTVGISTIAELSRRAVLVLPGEEKAMAYQRVFGANGYDPTWPSSIVADCRDGVVYADRFAAGM
jgi:glucosamine-6-phosphate deaminase